MKRTLVFWAAFATFALVAGAVVACTSYAQIDSYEHIFTQTKGDDDVVAVVQGKDLLRGDVRKPVEYRQAKDESLTKNQATKLNIVPLVDNLVILAEVERRQLLPDDKETTEYMQHHQDVCLGEHGADCRAEIASLGYSVEEYFEVAFEDYRTTLGYIRLHHAVFEEQGVTDAGNEARSDAVDAFLATLKANAVIVWHDVELRKLYEEAIAE